jgi:hypothetical protein
MLPRWEELRHARPVRALYRLSPGSRGAVALVIAAALVRAPVFPTVSMTRSTIVSTPLPGRPGVRGARGGDEIDFGFALRPLAEHLRYERTWRDHRPGTALLLDAFHPWLVASIALGSAHAVSLGFRRTSRRKRVRIEIAVRRAGTFALGLFGLLVGLRLVLGLGLVAGPRGPLLGLLAAIVITIMAFATGGDRGATPPRKRALRLVLVLALGAPLLVAWLVLFAAGDGSHLPHVPWVWAGSCTLLGVGWLASRRVRGSQPARAALR